MIVVNSMEMNSHKMGFAQQSECVNNVKVHSLVNQTAIFSIFLRDNLRFKPAKVGSWVCMALIFSEACLFQLASHAEIFRLSLLIKDCSTLNHNNFIIFERAG